MSNGAVFRFQLNLSAVHRQGNIRLFQNQCLTVIQFCFDLWFEFDANLLLGIEHIHRYLLAEVAFDDIIENVETLLNRHFLDGVACQLLDFFLSQVIDEILLGGRGLDGEGLFFWINHDAVTVQTFLELLI